jgi:heterogeneous nuclear ribonucleoprotein U-like protein 1
LVELSFSVNGVPQGVAFYLTREELNGRALFPHILTKNCRFEVNFGQKEDPWFPPTEGYEWASEIPLDKRLRGAIAPSTRAECQIIAMCGLPYAGKTTYANKFSMENPDRKFNVLGTNAILEKMKLNGLPRRKTYTGKKYVKISLIFLI